MNTNVGPSAIEQHSANALNILRKQDLPPDPANYHVFFEYASGTSPAMNRILDIYLSNKRHLDTATVQSLFETYVAPKFKDANATATDELDQIVSRTMSVIQETESNAKELAGGAAGVAQALGKTGTGNLEISAVIEKLGTLARNAVARAQAAEGELKSTKAETQLIKERFEAANKAALTDGLTEIPNRKNFDQTLRRLAAEAMETGASLSMAMVDIDHFKKFNDTYGHPLGDNVIKLVAHQLSDGSRPEDFVARYGGEEFSLLMANVSGADATDLVDRIRQSIAKKVLKKRDTGEEIGCITVSCGVATYSFGETLESFVERADASLYRAKQSGRNRVVFGEVVVAQ